MSARRPPMEWPVPRSSRRYAVIALGLVLLVMAGLLLDWLDNGLGAVQRGKRHRTAAMMREWGEALTRHREKRSSFPAWDGEIVALKRRYPSSFPATLAITDAWNNPTWYSSDGRSYVIVSFGKDRRPGGESSSFEEDFVFRDGRFSTGPFAEPSQERGLR